MKRTKSNIFVRRSRRNTTFEYRDSSSLTPAQFMEQEVYFARAEEAVHGSLPIAQLICLLLNDFL